MAADPTAKAVQSVIEAVQRKKGEDGDRLVLPRFQRTIVWSRAKQIDLVDSIHREYPVGALLWWKAPSQSSGGGTDYVLVDGLQRTMALKRYLDEPLSYKTFDLLPERLQARLIAPFESSLGDQLDEEAATRGINGWFAATGRCEMGKGFEAQTVTRAVEAALGLPSKSLSGIDQTQLNSTLDELRKWIEKVGSTVVPVVVWDGRQDELPEVFRRLNRTAQKLTAYDLLAAQWYETAVRLKSKTLQDEVEAKYETLASEDMEVIDTRSFEDLPEPDSLYNLYEYLVALGRQQAKKRPYLFKPPREDEFDNPGWAFSAATVAHGLRINAMESLPKRFAREADERVIDPLSFQDAFEKSIAFVWEALSPFLGVNLNRKEDTPVDREHTELQMVGMVCSTLVSCWQADASGQWERRSDWKTKQKTLRTTLPQRYLLEILEDDWRGSGDTKAFNLVWDDSGSNLQPSPHYLQPVKRDTLGDALDRWFEREGISRVQKERPLVRPMEKMVLRFVYSRVLRVYQDRGQPFDIEHLFPVKRLVELAKADTASSGWPISSVANLALLDIELNRGKRELTISEALRKEQPSARSKKRQRLEELILCSVKDVDIPKSFNRERYISFLRTRWMTLRGYILEGLYDN